MQNIVSTWNYLPPEKDALRWGIYVKDGGHTRIPENSPYPLSRHPDEYLFSWAKGRILQEYQIVYITQGGGVFETNETGKVRVTAGQIFLLFPGVWHRYKPDASTGWHENWIGFRGEFADRIMKEFFTPQSAVLTVGYDQELLTTIRSIPELIEQAPPGYMQLMAAKTGLALAHARSRSMTHHGSEKQAIEKIQKAKYHLLEHSAEDIDMEGLAQQLGLSYSRFRAMFKEQTGTAPHQYLIDIRMNKARDLLMHSEYSVSEISDRLGFSSPYYFSRIFKKKNKCSPSALRNRSGELR